MSSPSEYTRRSPASAVDSSSEHRLESRQRRRRLGGRHGHAGGAGVRLAVLPSVMGVLVLLLAACSSSAKPSSDGTTKGAATAAAIKVGLICDCSGELSSIYEPQADVYEAWVDATDASGGIAGHKIDLIRKDDADNPGTAVSDMEALISDHVDAVVDASVLTPSWERAVDTAGIPVVGADATEQAFYTDPNFYDEGQTNDSSVTSVIATAKEAGASNVAVFYCAEAPSCSDLVNPTKAAAKAAGLPVNLTETISLTAPNYTAQCVAAQQAHVSAIIDFTTAAPLEELAGNCASQGYNPIYVTEGDGFFPKELTTTGLKNNLWSEYNDAPFWTKAPAIEQMNAAVDKYYPGLRNKATEWNEGAAEAWPAGILLADAVKAGGLSSGTKPSPAEIVKGLAALHGDTLDGWSPPLTFTPGKTHSVDCWLTAHIADGIPAMANGGRVTCAKGS